MARRRLILMQDGAMGSRVLFIVVLGLYDSIFGKCQGELGLRGRKLVIVTNLREFVELLSVSINAFAGNNSPGGLRPPDPPFIRP